MATYTVSTNEYTNAHGQAPADGGQRILYTVSTNEYTNAHTLIGIANILERATDDVFPLEGWQVDAICDAIEAVRIVLPTNWCEDDELKRLQKETQSLLVAIENARRDKEEARKNRETVVDTD